MIYLINSITFKNYIMTTTFTVRFNQDQTFTVWYGEDIFDWFIAEPGTTLQEVFNIIQSILDERAANNLYY